MTPEEAWRKLAQTVEWRDAREVLLRRLERVAGPEASYGALSHLEGARSFAAHLLMLAEREEPHDGSAEQSDPDAGQPSRWLASRVGRRAVRAGPPGRVA